MTKNFDLLYTVLHHIKAHPETHDQRTWRCRTGMCFAGWAVPLSGARFVSDDYTSPYSEIVEVGDERVLVSEYAKEALGLTLMESYELFGMEHTIDGLEAIIDRWWLADVNATSEAEREALTPA